MSRIYNPSNDGYVRLFCINETAIPKPRMTRRDKWAKRPIVQRWNAYKDIIRLKAPPNFQMPFSNYWLIFTFQPKARALKCAVEEYGSAPHQFTPDKDNLEKGILDIFLPSDDSMVYDGRSSKLWGESPSIELWWKDDPISSW